MHGSLCERFLTVCFPAERTSRFDLLSNSLSGHRLALVDSVKFLSSAYTAAISLASHSAQYYAFLGHSSVTSSLPFFKLLSVMQAHPTIGVGCCIAPPIESRTHDDEVMQGCFPSVRTARGNLELCDSSGVLIRRATYHEAAGFDSRYLYLIS